MEGPWLTILEHRRWVRLWQGFRTFESFRYFDSNELNLSADNEDPFAFRDNRRKSFRVNDGSASF